MVVQRRNTILILAAGGARRFSGTKKQLLQIGEHTILQRIVLQCRKHNVFPIVVTLDEEIALATISYAEDEVYTYMPFDNSVTSATLLSTRSLWGNTTRVLLGDTIYSPDAMQKIMSCNDDFRVFGDQFELFSIVFTDRVHDDFAAALEKAKRFKRGKLRYAYRYFVGKEPDCKNDMTDPRFAKIEDWTNDIDMQSEYDNMLREVVAKGLLKNV